MAGAGSSFTWTGDIVINGNRNPKETVAEIKRVLKRMASQQAGLFGD